MKTINILYLLLILQIATLLAVVLNAPVQRQFFGFLYLSFLPGYLLLKLFKLEKVGLVETVLFSVGISLAFLMFCGLLLNLLSTTLGLPNPLSTLPIVTSLSTIVLVIYCLVYAKRKELSKCPLPDFKFSPIAFLLVGIPIITVFGTELARIYANPFVLMLLVIIVCLVVIGAFWKGVIPAKNYPLAILAISFFLLFHISLVTNFLIGADVHAEYFFAQLTATKSFWDRTIFHPYNPMLSITILPTVFSKFLNLDMNWVFKVLYPLIYLLIPLSLYHVYRKQMGSFIAFLSVFFFMSTDVFFVQMLGLARQIIGELFFALLILLMFEERISLTKRRILFFVLSWALIVSHYSVAYLFTFFLLANLLLLDFFEGTTHSGKKSIQVATGSMVLGYILMVFVWNLFFTHASFDSLATFLNYVYKGIVSYIPGPGVSGLMPNYLSPLHEVSRYIFYLPQILIAIGVIGLLVKRKEPLLEPTYSTMAIASMSVLLMCMFLPAFAGGLNMTRFYHLSLFLLAPFPFVGGITLFNLITSIRSRFSHIRKEPIRVKCVSNRNPLLLLVTVILIFVFLFQVGFPYELAADIPTSISLSRNRVYSWSLYMEQLYVEQPEVSSVEWLSKNGNSSLAVYADTGGSEYLTSYGLVSSDRLKKIDQYTVNQTIYGSYLFFDKINVLMNKVMGYNKVWNATDFFSLLNSADRIYSNGASDIYCGRSK